MEGRPITIIGGGIAGLTLGILLRTRGVPVTIFEAGDYPRHKVCGEFISGPGQRILEKLGLLQDLRLAGLRLASQAQFYWGGKLAAKLAFPVPAWALSRHALDALLANAFIARGGALRAHERWRNTGPARAGVVNATGHFARAGRAAAWRFIGLKAHAANLPLEADLEMHGGPSGYFGLCRLSGGIVNVCALLRTKRPIPQLNSQWLDHLRAIASPGLRARLEAARFLEETFCATAGLSYAPLPRARGDLRVGDASGLIAPITGNGMSLAIESAAEAAPELADYSCGSQDWDAAIRRAHSKLRRFERRRRVARALQGALFSDSPLVPQALARAARVPLVGRLLFEKTRS